MNSKFVRLLVAVAFVMPVGVLAQNAAAPDAPSAASTTPMPVATGSKIGTINIEQAIFATNEGQRDFEALSKKLEPKQTELKKASDDLDELKKQLNTQGDKLNDQARGTLVKQIETKQKSFDRSVQDARDDAQSQQQEIANRILQKLAPIIVKYAGDSGYGLILDTSNPWPQGPVVWNGAAVDITKAVVDNFNAQSGVPAPAASAARTPAARPTTPAPKPANPNQK
jgi:outer membrane protein